MQVRKWLTGSRADRFLIYSSLLGPIGQYRRAHTNPSKGSRAARQVRARGDSDVKAATTMTSALPTPARPDLADYVDVGFNVITRELETRCHSEVTVEGQRAAKKPYCMIFVARGNLSSAFYCHFPQMVAVASQRLEPSKTIRLIGFSKPCSERLSNCLGIARVSSLAITESAPGADALWSFVQEHVAEVNTAWLEETWTVKYKATRIASVETTVGAKRSKTGKDQRVQTTVRSSNYAQKTKKTTS